MKKRWWLLVLVVVLLGGGYLVLQQRRGATEQAEGEAEVETAVVERGTLQITVDGSGSLGAQQEVVVPFETGGRVVEILVEAGDIVKAGDVMVRLDEADAQRALADAELQVAQAEVTLASAQLTLDDLLTWELDESDVELAEANLASAQVDYRKAIANRSLSGDQLTSAEVNLAQAQRNLDDAIEAYDDAYDPGRDWELGDKRRSSQLEAERESASDRLMSARESLAVAQASYNLEVAGVADSGVAGAWSKVVSSEISLEDVKEPPDEDEITSARLQVEQQQISLDKAELALASAEEDLADTQLRASVSGTVTEIDLILGQNVANGQTGAVLADLSTLQVEIGLDESDISQVSVGQAAEVTLDAFDDVTLDGEIVHIAPTAVAQSGVVLYDVTIELAETQIPVRVGMTADVEIVTRSATNALTVPLKAVRSMNGRAFVLRQLRDGEEAPELSGGGQMRPPDGGQMPAGVSTEDVQAMRAQMQTALSVEGFAMTPVELGVMTDAYAEVLQGLEEGDVVLVSSTNESASSENGPGGMFPMMGGRP